MTEYRKEVGNKAPKETETAIIGIYYDDPYNLVDPDKLRACCGLLLDKSAP